MSFGREAILPAFWAVTRWVVFDWNVVMVRMERARRSDGAGRRRLGRLPELREGAMRDVQFVSTTL